MRGKRDDDRVVSDFCGSIPACAGETAMARSLLASRKVYPRLCGGNLYQGVAQTQYLGLSPLVRGKPWDPGLDGCIHGSIPACAGETISCSQTFLATRVYPRLCGGNDASLIVDRIERGLSPLVRGKPYIDLAGDARVGSIPACAGETYRDQ